jgi:Cof subfamily protein (haloacid dehalogenase superfamily)
MSYKIIASDLDGTLFNKKGEISEENSKAIKTLYEMGVHFVPTSGRSFGEMPPEIRKNPYIRYYIGSDGATVYDKVTDTTHSLTIPTELSHFILDKLFTYPVNMMLHADNNSYVDADMHNEADYRKYNYSQSWIDFTFETNLPKPDFQNFAYTKDVEMFCVFFKNPDELLECKEFFGAHPDLLVAQSYKHNLEIFYKTAGKGNALMLLADILGVDRKDTIAVGDSTNDYTMVKMAGLGLAMDNAVDELKAVADEVICNNEMHSAQYILEHYVK